MSIPPPDRGAAPDRKTVPQAGAGALKARPGASTLERRAQARKVLRTRVVLTLPNARPVEGRCIDISASGMGLVVDFNLPSASPCQLAFVVRFNDESTYTAEVSGRIAYCMLGNDMSGFKIGVQFIGLSERASAAFERYLKG